MPVGLRVLIHDHLNSIGLPVHEQDRDQQRQHEHDNTDRIKISMC